MHTTILIGIIFLLKFFMDIFQSAVSCVDSAAVFTVKSLVGVYLFLTPQCWIYHYYQKKKYVCHPPHKYPCTVLWRLLSNVKKVDFLKLRKYEPLLISMHSESLICN